MARSYSEQSDGSLLGVEDDVLITLRLLAAGLEVAKAQVQAWLNEALAEGES